MIYRLEGKSASLFLWTCEVSVSRFVLCVVREWCVWGQGLLANFFQDCVIYGTVALSEVSLSGLRQGDRMQWMDAFWGKMMRASVLIGIMVCIVGIAMGCASSGGTTMQVLEYPQFFTGTKIYQSIAVGKTENRFEPNKFVYDINRYILGSLVEKQQYQVVNATEVDAPDNEILDHIRHRQVAELAIFNTITDYLTEYDGYIKDTYADVYMTVIDVRTGQPVYAATHRGRCYDGDAYGGNVSSYEAQMCAIRDAIDKGIGEICPVVKVLQVQGDMIQIYRLNEASAWEEMSVFSENDIMRIAFVLPIQAKYNMFRYDILNGENDQILIDEHIFYGGQEISVEQDIAQLLEKSGGAHHYKVRLWSNEDVVFTKGIDVKGDYSTAK